MVSFDEMLLFNKEVKLMINEYIKCDDLRIKEQIYDDILFLSEILKVNT